MFEEAEHREIPEISIVKVGKDKDGKDKYARIEALSVSIDKTLMFTLNDSPPTPPKGPWKDAEIIGKGKVVLVEMKHKVGVFKFANE